MTAVLQVEAQMDVICTTADSEDASELGYFFQTAGAIKFSDAGFESPGFASTVVVADRYGVIVYSDLQGDLVVSPCFHAAQWQRPWYVVDTATLSLQLFTCPSRISY